MFQDITIEEWLERREHGDLTAIDVRSPSEFEDSTVPGSINIPLFDDEERRQVGTLYKQVSTQAAKEKGLELVSRKLPAFVKRFEEIDGRKAVFCWRGGMRSKTTATVLSLMGIRVYRLLGGYRAYRKWVLETLESFKLKPTCVVIHGDTGTGKTLILHKLRERGFPVLDLEGLAQHRGSIFGQVGLKPNNQKTFESLLLDQLLRDQQAPYLLMEAESKRVGKVVVPPFLVEGKENGIHLFVDIPIEERIRNIIADYEPEKHADECLAAFEQIKRRMHTPVAAQIESALHAGRYAEAVELLLIHYYDPRYEHATDSYGAQGAVLSAANTDEAADMVAERLKQLFPDAGRAE